MKVRQEPLSAFCRLARRCYDELLDFPPQLHQAVEEAVRAALVSTDGVDEVTMADEEHTGSGRKGKGTSHDQAEGPIDMGGLGQKGIHESHTSTWHCGEGWY